MSHALALGYMGIGLSIFSALLGGVDQSVLTGRASIVHLVVHLVENER
jgi:hypothetical protein